MTRAPTTRPASTRPPIPQPSVVQPSNTRPPSAQPIPGISVTGPAMTTSFVRDDLPALLGRLGLLPDPSRLAETHRRLRQGLAALGPEAGASHVMRAILRPLLAPRGPADARRCDPVRTREGPEAGGHQLGGLRAWACSAGTDLDAPGRLGATRAACRVLRATQEVLGLLTNGEELRLLLCDPGLPDSHLAFPLVDWRRLDAPPAALDVLLGLVSPEGRARLPELLRQARLAQARVTDALQRQARIGLELFLLGVVERIEGPPPDAAALWRDGLVLIHRLLFILKLEASADPARGFSFAATRLWREALSPNLALAPLARRCLDHGHTTGRLLEDGLRQLFRAFREGFACAELVIAPLGGGLFGAGTMPVLEGLAWGERPVALLLDRLLWTSEAGRPRARVHYGSLDVEVLGGVYETLLDLDPVIDPATPVAPTHPTAPVAPMHQSTPVAPPTFRLRAGAARKASGSYYTPAPFVDFLVNETLGPACRRASAPEDPDPGAILALRVVDPAMGSGHFLVAACRVLAEALLEACQSCHRQAQAEPGSARAASLRARLAALPDADGLLASYLGHDGIAEARARALCRRMVAMHCLYGVDRNALAVELAKLSLWLEAHAEGLPLTFLDHRLLVGDSLAGPFIDDLGSLPVGGGPLDTLLSDGLGERLATMRAGSAEALRAIGATLGRDLGDLATKRQALDHLAAIQAPLLNLARAWAGAAMRRDRADDDEWQALARAVAATGAWPTRLTPAQAAQCQAGAEALPWNLVFAERDGFDAVIGNPPWDVLQYSSRDFLGAHDPAILDAPTARERAAIEARLLADPAIAAAFARYREGFTWRKRIADRLFRHQRADLGSGGGTAGNADLFRLFAERAVRLASGDGAIGLLLPSAFHANDGTTALRRLFLANGLDTCLSFENRAGLFDIDSRFKFALVVARRPGPTRALRCAFYLRGLGDLADPDRVMTYDPAFIAAAGGSRMTLLELLGQRDLAIARRMFARPSRLAAWCEAAGIRLGRDLHMTDDAHRFTPRPEAGDGPDWLLLHEGKTFHQYTDSRVPAPRYAVRADRLADKPRVAAAVGHFRLAFRDIARSNDERSMIATLLPPGSVCGHTVTVEKTPAQRDLGTALALCAVLNSFAFDWLVRLKTATHLSLYLLADLPMPTLDDDALRRLAAIAAHLCGPAPRFAPLRRRAGPLPDTGGADPRAVADAIVARGYGLDADDYARVLASFRHADGGTLAAACLRELGRLADAEDHEDGHDGAEDVVAAASCQAGHPGDALAAGLPGVSVQPGAVDGGTFLSRRS